MNDYPVPNGPDLGNGVAEFIGSWSNPASINSTSVRFDHALNDKLRLFFRFSNTTSSSAARGTNPARLPPTVVTTAAYTTRSYTAGNTSVFTSRLSNQVRLNYSSNETTQSQVIDPFRGSPPINLAWPHVLRSGTWVSFMPLAYPA